MSDPSQFLRAALDRAFVWGESDCFCWVSDWIHQVRGVDPAAPWRGRYSDEAGAIAFYGEIGFTALVEAAMAAAGLDRTSDPQPGDVGLVLQAGTIPTLAIRTGLGWACKADVGVRTRPHTRLMAWSV